MEAVSNFLIKIGYVPVLITAGYALYVFRKLPHSLKVISWFIFFSGIIQIASAILWYMKQNNMPLLHLYNGVGFLLLTWYYGIILDGFINKRLIRVIAWLFVVSLIVNTLLFQGLFTFPSNSLVLESILLIILSLSTFILLLDEVVKESKASIIKSLNWINSGIFLYYSSSLLIFYFGDLIANRFSRATNLSTWALHFFFMTTMYVCFLVGLWKRPDK